MSEKDNVNAVEGLKGLEAKYSELEKKFVDESTKNKDLVETVNKMSAALAEAKKDIGTLVKSSAEKPEKPKKIKIPNKNFKVGKKTYRFRFAKFSYQGSQMTALDALADEAVLKDLVNSGSGVLKEVH